eukprot:403377103
MYNQTQGYPQQQQFSLINTSTQNQFGGFAGFRPPPGPSMINPNVIQQQQNQTSSMDPINQAKLFKQLQEETQSIHQILMKSSTNVPGSGLTTGLSGANNFGIGSRLGVGAGLAQYQSISGASGAKSIDQILLNLRQKTENQTLSLDQNAQNQARTFFSSKNVDMGELEHSMKTSKDSLLMLQKSQREKAVKQGSMAGPAGAVKTSQLISTFFGHGMTGTSLTGDKVTDANEIYKQRLLSTNQSQLISRQINKALHRNLTQTLVEKCKLAAAQIQVNDLGQIELPPPRQFNASVQSKYRIVPARQGLREDQKMQEEQKQQRFPGANLGGIASKRAQDMLIVNKEGGINWYEDTDENIATQFIEKVMKKEITLRYDDHYLLKIKNKMVTSSTQIIKTQRRATFEEYTKGLKRYTEEKFYSNNQNLPYFILTLKAHEDQLRDYYLQDRSNDTQKAIQYQRNQTIHSQFSDILDYLHILSRQPELKKLTIYDVHLNSEDYQRFIAKYTAEYFEYDYKRLLFNESGINQHSKGSQQDQYAVFEDHVARMFSRFDEEQAQALTQAAFQDQNTGVFVFAVVFYMFRCGQHKTAIFYLKSQENDLYRRFGELYSEYYDRFGQSLPSNEVMSFYNKCQMATEDIHDMYKDALICQMMGSQYNPPNSNVFWELLLNWELETQIWFKLKLAAYKLSEGDSELQKFRGQEDLPAMYQPINLSTVQKMIIEGLGEQYFKSRPIQERESCDVVTYFKVLMLLGKYSLALNELVNQPNLEFQIEGNHFAIILSELGILKTRSDFFQMIQDPNFDKQTPLAHLQEHLSDCYDYHQNLSFFIQEAANGAHYVTETVSLIFFLKHGSLVLNSLAQFIINNGLFELLLENDSLRSILGGFDINNKLTLRNLIQDDMYVSLVELITKLNEDSSKMNLNIMLYDKIKKHDKVFQVLNKLQKELIMSNIHPFFLQTTNQGQEAQFNDFFHNPQQPTIQIQKDYSELLNEYEKKGLKKKYQEEYKVLDYLDSIVQAYNNIIERKFEDALRRFGDLTFLPVRKQDEPAEKARIFENLSPEIRSIFFEVIIMIGKCIHLVFNFIRNETKQFADTSKASQLRIEKLNEYRNVLEKLTIYLDYIRQGHIAILENRDKLTDAANFIKKTQILIA